MSAVNLIIAVLSVWQIVEIWHHGSIFATPRARIELWEGFAGRLLRCPFCLSLWVSLFVVLWLSLGDYLITHVSRPAGQLALAPLFAFAVSRGANLANDVFHSFSRTPRAGRLDGGGEDLITTNEITPASGSDTEDNPSPR